MYEWREREGGIAGRGGEGQGGERSTEREKELFDVAHRWRR